MTKMMAMAALMIGLTLMINGAAAEQSVEEIKRQQTMDRLLLTDEQRVLVEPILIESRARRVAILQSVGIEEGDKLKLRKVLKVRKPLKELQADTQERLSTILTPPQMDEYRVIVGEARAKILAQFK